MPAISILMPIKNAGHFLIPCLESIIHQSLTDFELIGIDDGSADESLNRLKSYAAADHRIKVFSNQTPGIINALSLAFNHSKGKFIHRMDADDVMPRDKLATLHRLISTRTDKVVATGKVKYFSTQDVSPGYQRYQDWINSLSTNHRYQSHIYRECVVASPNWMVDRKCFERDIIMNSLAYPEDYDLVLRWHQMGYIFICSEQITHLWRDHGDRTSRNSEIYDQNSFFKLKTSYFIKNEINDDNQVQLIGAAEKGKKIAKILINHGIKFQWFDLNQTVEKYGHQIRPVSEVNNKHPTILSAWPLVKSQQEKIVNYLDSKGLTFGNNLWLF
ncbi:MAG: glycosyl transferase family 2 [Zetaproteobacteria bacterium]|nr:glycosyl transferase family 2 [Pseudobdellovibrionaceae bacterium]|tara:strand:+ start:302 stop:1291 length:990 start_codon:yes stop_codon:yes gene_type:complete